MLTNRTDGPDPLGRPTRGSSCGGGSGSSVGNGSGGDSGGRVAAVVVVVEQ